MICEDDIHARHGTVEVQIGRGDGVGVARLVIVRLIDKKEDVLAAVGAAIDDLGTLVGLCHLAAGNLVGHSRHQSGEVVARERTAYALEHIRIIAAPRLWVEGIHAEGAQGGAAVEHVFAHVVVVVRTGDAADVDAREFLAAGKHAAGAH